MLTSNSNEETKPAVLIYDRLTPNMYKIGNHVRVRFENTLLIEGPESNLFIFMRSASGVFVV